MNRPLNSKLILFLIAFLALPVFAQSDAKIEQELVKILKDVQEYSSYGDGYDEDKLSAANELFEDRLVKYTKIGSTLSYGFPELDKLLFISTSDDGKFRIYSWDTETGGTMHDYSRVYQFRGTEGRVYSETDPDLTSEDGGVGSFVYDIFTLELKVGNIYIVCSTFIGSSQDHYQSANLYRIEGTKLNDEVKLIKTKSGLTNTLGFGYNFFSVVERTERPIKLINYDKKTKTLRIPVVIEDDEFLNGRVTDRFIKYRFDGRYFVKAR